MKLSRLFIPILFFGVLSVVTPGEAKAKDTWIKVTTKNFTLIGNASEKDIRKVGTKLEQFRETFRLLFRSANLTSATPTNVVVFKSSSSFKNFKPKRSDGKIDTGIAGYFQAGEDVNYIVLSTEGDDKETFGTIFHEYVHFIINANFGKSEVPQWFNEGLAEYYQTFEIADDIKVKLGLPQSGHLLLLQQSKLMPLETLFGVSNYQLLQTGGHSRSIFYAQSWALVHYLTQAGKSDALNKFLSLIIRGDKPQTAFENAFQTTYEKMEADLRKYVGGSRYNYNQITFKTKLVFDQEMQVSLLDEAESNVFLGDLLYHTDRLDDAEPFLVNALASRPDHGMANTTLGMIKLKQRKFDEARKLLEKAIETGPKNHIAYYQYGYLLSREGRDEFGFVQKFEPETARQIRESLKKAIAINPAFGESYELLAFIALVNNDDLEDALAQLKTALKYHPANGRYSIRIAEILARQLKFDEAQPIADKVLAGAEDSELKNRADFLLRQISDQKDFYKRQAADRKRFDEAIVAAGGSARVLKRIEGVEKPPEPELFRINALENLRSINDVLRKPKETEQRLIGFIEKIDCKKRPILFTVKNADETFTVSSSDFNSLELNALDPLATNYEIGCGSNITRFNAVITYRPLAVPKLDIRGELVAIEFVPADFRLMSESEMNGGVLVIYDEPKPVSQTPTTRPPTPPTQADIEKRRSEMIMKSISDAIRKPADGEKRDMGFLEKIECTDKNSYFYIRTPNGIIKLLNPAVKPPNIVVYAPDLGGVRFGCGTKAIEFPAVFVYSDKPDKKAKTAGDMISIEFVPKSFILAQ